MTWQSFEILSCRFLRLPHRGGPGRQDCGGAARWGEAKAKRITAYDVREIAAGANRWRVPVRNGTICAQKGWTEGAKREAAKRGLKLSRCSTKRRSSKGRNR